MSKFNKIIILSTVSILFFIGIYIVAIMAMESKLKSQLSLQLQSQMHEKLFSDDEYITNEKLINFFIKDFNSKVTTFEDVSPIRISLIMPTKIHLDALSVMKPSEPLKYGDDAYENKSSTSILVKGQDRLVLFSYQYSIGILPMIIFVIGYLLSLYFFVFRQNF